MNDANNIMIQNNFPKDPLPQDHVDNPNVLAARSSKDYLLARHHRDPPSKLHRIRVDSVPSKKDMEAG